MMRNANLLDSDASAVGNIFHKLGGGFDLRVKRGKSAEVSLGRNLSESLGHVHLHKPDRR